MSLYTCGFMFDKYNNVLMIKKTKDWQQGLLNGIGGTIEKDEYPPEAMIREFKEKDIDVKIDELRLFLTLQGKDWIVWFHRIKRYELPQGPGLRTISPIALVTENVIPNCRWIIPMALDETLKTSVLIVLP